MTPNAASDPSSPLTVQLSRRTALWTLTALGLALASIVLFDVYRDWVPQGIPLWSTLAENALPLLLALALPAAAWHLARSDASLPHLSAATKGAVTGCVATLVTAGLVLAFHTLQGSVKPTVFISQLMTAGAVAGLFVGYNVAQVQDIRDELHAREARLRGLANSVPGGIFQFEVRPDGTQTFTFVSDQNEELLGISTDPDGYFERFVERVPLSHRKELLESIETAIRNESGWSFEMPFDRPDGERIWVRGISSPERRPSPDGRDTLVYHGVSIDVTERHKAIQELRRSRKRLETAQDIARLGSWERVPETGASYWSDEMYEIFGWAPDRDPSLEAVMAALPEDDRGELRRRREAALTTGDTFELEHRLHRPDGEERIVQTRGKVEEGAADTPTRLVGTMLDVTEQKRREHEVERLRQKYQGLLEGAPDAIFVAEYDTGRIVEANEAAATLLNTSVDTLAGQHIGTVHPSDENDNYEALFQRAGTEKVGSVETLSQFDDGSPVYITPEEGSRVPVEVSVTRVDIDDRAFVIEVFRDIRHRREMERRYEAIFNQTFQFIGLLEPDGTLIEANEAALNAGELAKEDVLGQPVWNTYWFQTDADTPQKLRRAVRRAADGEFVRYEETIQGTEGARVIDFSIRPITNEQGEVHLLIPEGRDITARKRRAKEAKRRANAMEAASDGMAVLDAEGRYTFVNQAHAEIYGYSDPDALLGEHWGLCYDEDELQRFEEAVIPNLNEAGEWRGEALGKRADGSLFSQELTLTALPDGGIICVVRDITERKARTRELRQQGTALDQAGEAVLVTSADRKAGEEGEIVYANEAFEAMTGYAETDLLGETPDLLRGPDTDPAVIASLREALAAEEKWEGETVNYRKDGTSYLAHWSATPVHDDDGTIQRWVSVHRDVTEERRRERELQAAKEAAEEANRLKSALLANMSHEFRTPLTSIIGFAEAIGEQAEPSSADAADLDAIDHFSDLIEKSGRRLMDTLASVMKLSKLQAGEVDLTLAPCNLAEAIEEAADLIRPAAETAGLTFEVEFPETPVWGRADPNGLQIVLGNLLDNAVKFTEPGGSVVLRARKDGNSVLVEVEDTGIGMAPNDVEELFDAFKQESEGLGREYEGSGLGLTVAQSLIQKMNGQIEVDTEKDQGARFILRLPLSDETLSESDSSDGSSRRSTAENEGRSEERGIGDE